MFFPATMGAIRLGESGRSRGEVTLVRPRHATSRMRFEGGTDAREPPDLRPARALGGGEGPGNAGHARGALRRPGRPRRALAVPDRQARGLRPRAEWAEGDDLALDLRRPPAPQ